MGNELRGKMYTVYNHRGDIRRIIANSHLLLYVIYRYCQYIVR